MALKQKTTFITDWVNELQEYISQIEVIKQNEKFLGFEPIVGKFSLNIFQSEILITDFTIDAHAKLQELKKIKLVHQQLLLESEDSTQGVEEILATYNDLVERISTHIRLLNMDGVSQ